MNSSSCCVISSSPTLVAKVNRNPYGRRRFPIPNRIGNSSHSGCCRTRIAAIREVVGADTDPVTAEITWQIVVGSLAGVTPFVVAGIEFGKRVIAQKKCGVCGGSGLVLRGKNYSRCPGCGGFLPWQSWKRFFTG